MNKANIGVELEQAVLLYSCTLMTLSVQALQSLVNICNSELSFLDMSINPKKSACMRFGPKYRNVRSYVPMSWHLDL